MLLVDDVLLFPIRSILWIFREIYQAAQQEMAGEADSITARLSELYMMLETGQMSDEDFAAEEKRLLDRLEEIEARNRDAEADGNDQEEDDDEEVIIERKTKS